MNIILIKIKSNNWSSLPANNWLLLKLNFYKISLQKD